MLSLVKLVFLREEIDGFPSSHFAWNRIVYTGGEEIGDSSEFPREFDELSMTERDIELISSR